MRQESADEEVTVDAFHRGAFHLVQPAKRGHRAGTDAMLVAAAVPSNFAGTVADLGAGAGAAGLAVAARCPGTGITLIDNAREMLGYARRGLELPENAALSPRVTLLEADIALAGERRAESGLERESFDFAIMNPPFNAMHDRATDDPLRRTAHVMEDDTLFETWLRTTAAILKPRGAMALIARPASLDVILQAARGRFGDLELMPVHPRAEARAIRIVMRARKGGRGGMAILPPLMMHEGIVFSARAQAISDGRASLFGD